MGFFDNLFKKKECDICGSEIGLLGNRKLEDGNLCKDCAKKLSPWFDDRRHSTVEEIKEQLAYREENKKVLEGFQPDQVIGERYMVYIEKENHRFLVTSSRDYQEENPDVFRFEDVLDCTLDISDSRREEKYENNEGEKVSYNPPRYLYQYDFYMNLRLKHRFIDEIRFRLNQSPLQIQYRCSTFFDTGLDPEKDYEYRKFRDMGEEIRNILLHSGPAAEKPEIGEPAEIPAGSDEEMTPEPSPVPETVCPYCDTKMTPAADGCCSCCGAKL